MYLNALRLCGCQYFSCFLIWFLMLLCVLHPRLPIHLFGISQSNPFTYGFFILKSFCVHNSIEQVGHSPLPWLFVPRLCVQPLGQITKVLLFRSFISCSDTTVLPVPVSLVSIRSGPLQSAGAVCQCFFVAIRMV